MSHVSLKPGDSLTVGEDITIQFDKFRDGCSLLDVYDAYNEISVVRGTTPEPTEEEIRAYLWTLSKEIVDGLSKLEPAGRSELLGALVRELYYSAAAQERREKNHRRQAEGIAAAKARGARFGPSRKPLPDNFDECYRKWRDGEITMREAAMTCGMAKSSFYDAVARKERAIDRAV